MVQGFVTPPPRSRLRRKRLLAAVAATCSSALLLAAAAPAAHASPGQTITDLTSISATDLVTKIIGDGITVSNVQYTGNPLSAGTFAGLDPVGFDSGIVLSSGEASAVVGPNDSPGKTGTMETLGDSDLNAIVDPYGTEDASVLTFDFVPTTSQLVFDYVFSSEEYFEYVNTTFNDVFAFLVNGENCAITEDGAPVAINTINGGNPLGTGASRPTLYRNNVADDETGTAPLDLQADGLTVVMKCAATVNPNVSNRMKLAIADTTDASLDSAVFIRAGSLQANKAPSAADKSATTVEGTAVGVTLSGSDPDGDDLTFDVATQPGHGTLTGTGANLTYTPANGYAGTDSFTYTANDGAASSAPATVSITVTAKPPVNKAPSAADKSATTVEGTAVGVTLSGSDPDGDDLTFDVATQPGHGTLTGTGANLTYTPANGYAGTDSFTYTANDGAASSAPATVSITVTAKPPVNKAPSAADKSATTVEGTAVGVTLSGSDPDGDDLTFDVATQPGHGTLTGTGANLTYTPANGYTGTDSFTYTANDGAASSAPATVSITVTAKPASCAAAPVQDALVSTNQKKPSSVFTSGSVSTSTAGQLVLAFVEADGPKAPTQKVTSVTGGGLTWKLAVRSNSTWGTTEVWQAWAPQKVTGIKVKATLASAYNGSMTVVSWKGAASTVGATAAAAGADGKPSVTLKTKSCHAQVWAAGHNWSRPVPAAPVAGQSLVHQFVDTGVHDTYWVQKFNTPVVKAGTSATLKTQTLAKKDRWTFAAVEVRPAS